MFGQVTCEVCVVGLGASGLTAINELTQKGVKVIGVDAEDVGSGAAGKNGGSLMAGLHEFYLDAISSFGKEYSLTTYRETLEELERVYKEFP